ncbi:MAG: hypothetical protein MJE77_13595 [Proteobacteria bacterium]|nr:hypothetical protein [Pseudomonadota bacterium]
MVGTTSDWINLNVFPTGRRVYALTEVERRAQTRGLDVVAQQAALGAAQGRQILALEGDEEFLANPRGSEELLVAKQEGQELLAETVALILSHYIVAAPGDRNGRWDLLEPILSQDMALRRANRERRQPLDVDPDTGNERIRHRMSDRAETLTG